MEPSQRIDGHELYNDDCMDVLAQLPDKSIDLVLTDVPYKQEFHGQGMSATRPNYLKIKQYGSDKDLDYTTLFDLCLKKLRRLNFFTFCDKETKFEFIKLAKEHGFGYKELCFFKTSPTPFCNNQWLADVEYGVHIFKNLPVMGTYKTKRSFFVLDNFKEDGVPHPSAKKVEVVAKILMNISETGDIVFDPFMGSGTTGLACHRLKRAFIGVEKNTEYFNLAAARIKQETNQLQLF